MSELDDLLEAWRKVRAPAYADAIDVVSRRRTGRRLPKSGNQARKQQRWMDRLAEAGEDLEPLLDALTDVDADLCTERLRALRARDDPRVARRLTEFLRSPPYVNLSTLPFWRTLFDLLEARADGRCLPVLDALDAMWVQKFRPYARPKIEALVAERRPRIAAACARVPTELDPEAAAQLPQAELSQAEEEAALFDAVVAAVDDDAPRLVYADWLMEQDDPRGELIALMVADGDARRIKALIDAHGPAWLGTLPAATRRVRWSRGFPVAATLTAKRQADAARAIGDRAWGTVEALTLAHPELNLLPLLTDPALANLRSLEGMLCKHARHLLAVPRPLPLRRLGLVHDDGALKRLSKAIADSRAIPNLERIAIATTYRPRDAVEWYRKLVPRLAQPPRLELEVLGVIRIVVDPEPKIIGVQGVQKKPKVDPAELRRVAEELGLPLASAPDRRR